MKWGPRALSFATGFLSLSQEILWIRYTSFAFFGVPQVLGLVLCCYLAGIAAGAAIGKRWCAEPCDLYGRLGTVLVIAGAFDLAAPWIATGALGMQRLLGIAVLPLVLFLTAMFKSIAFPIAHYLGSEGSGPRVGSSVSRVYFANIVGSTLGPLLTGFVLLQYLGLQRNFQLMAALTAAVGLACHVAAGRRAPLFAWGTALALGTALFVLPPRLLPELISATRADGSRTHYLVETRVGIIHTTSRGSEADITYGANVYDGRVSVDFLPDENSIYRLYVLGALHPGMHRVLLIGLSTGAWTEVLRGFPGIQSIDAVEINPGYLDIIARYPAVAPLLTDPRVHIHIDDGRRWIRRHPELQFDLIVINNTWHWRAFSSLLLSSQFVQLCRAHLLPGGIFSYNTTWSPDAFETAARQFRYAYRLNNFVVGSDRELSLSAAALRATLEGARIGGHAVVSGDDPRLEEHIRGALANFVPYPQWRATLMAQDGREPEVITDANLVGEYRHSDLSPLGQQLARLHAPPAAGGPQAPR